MLAKRKEKSDLADYRNGGGIRRIFAAERKIIEAVGIFVLCEMTIMIDVVSVGRPMYAKSYNFEGMSKFFSGNNSFVRIEVV